MAKKRWVIQQTEEGKYLLSQLEMKGGLWHCGELKTLESLPETLSGEVHYCISSTASLVLAEEFPKLSRELLLMQMHKRLDQMAMLDVGVSGAICYSALEERGLKQLYSMIVLPESEVEAGMNAVLASGKVRLRNCTTGSAAVAALLAKVSPDPLVVLLLQQQSAVVIGVRDGHALYQQSMQVGGSDELEEGILTHAINFCRQTLSREFAIDEAALVCLGTGRDTIDSGMVSDTLIEPDFKGLIRADSSDILHHPELFGALFVKPDFSFLPEGYKQSLVLAAISKVLTVTAAVAAVACGFLSWQQSRITMDLAEQLAVENRELNASIIRLGQQLPGMENVQQQEQYLQILAKSENEPHLDELLMALADRLPEQVRISGFEVEKRAVLPVGETMEMVPGTASIAPVASMDPAMSDDATAQQLSGPEQELDKKSVISLTLTSPGEYEMVRARFEMSVRQLSDAFQLEEIEWKYTEKHREGVLNCELHLPEKERG
jgi:hypothetical protein